MKKGFTLIELLVVVLIIGVLASVAVPQYRKAVLRSRTAQGLALLKSIEKAEEAYYLANGQYTVDLESLDLDLPKFNCTPSLCNFLSPGKEFLWEFTSGGDFRHYTLYCAAQTRDEAALQVCASLGTYSHINGLYRYYALSHR